MRTNNTLSMRIAFKTCREHMTDLFVMFVLGLLSVLIFIYINYMADFSCKMNSKRIVEFGFGKERSPIGLNNSDILLSLIQKLLSASRLAFKTD